MTHRSVAHTLSACMILMLGIAVLNLGCSSSGGSSGSNSGANCFSTREGRQLCCADGETLAGHIQCGYEGAIYCATTTNTCDVRTTNDTTTHYCDGSDCDTCQHGAVSNDLRFWCNTAICASAHLPPGC